MADLLTVLLLLICICTYVRGYRKGIFDVEDGSHSGLRGEPYRQVLQSTHSVFIHAMACLRQSSHVECTHKLQQKVSSCHMAIIGRPRRLSLLVVPCSESVLTCQFNANNLWYNCLCLIRELGRRWR